MNSGIILGISAYYHDSAAAIVRRGKIVAAAQEERFTRKKHDAKFPSAAVAYCLAEANVSLREVEAVVFYDKPLIKLERLLETYYAFAPAGFRSFLTSMPAWINEKIFLKSSLRKELRKLQSENEDLPPLWFTEHHQSHAASAFFPSPFPSAAVLCLDGVGEWTTSSGWIGRGHELLPLWEIKFPHSLGLLYSAFTYYAGFRVNSGEYKLMGLAPYGEPKYVQAIRENLIDIKEDGSFRLNLDYFGYITGLRMTNHRFHRLFGGPPRRPESPLTQKEMDLACSIQAVTEEIVLRLAKSLREETGEENICLAGGVALNCVANGRLLREGIFQNIWVQPAAGDAGGALGAALTGWHQFLGQARETNAPADSMMGSYLGPAFSPSAVAQRLEKMGAVFEIFSEEELLQRVAGLLDEGKVVGWMQGRMEFGPRALGSRSILGDPRNQEMQSTMNRKIKYRESFRPFAPAVLAEDVAEHFELSSASPYMLIVAPVAQAYRLPVSTAAKESGIDKLKVRRSLLPAITHVDFSARVQSVHAESNPRFHALLEKFKQRTGLGVLVNTSFNVRGEPIVCSPEDAYRCFQRTEMDYLVVENCLLAKESQPPLPKEQGWQKEFTLD